MGGTFRRIDTFLNRLMPNFTIEELSRSEYAIRHGIDNTPDRAAKLALIDLIDNVLQPLRDHFGCPVVVTSGFRSVKVNKAIGGSATSQHCLGMAADIHIPGHSLREVADWIAANLDFDQAIFEFGSWIHVSYRAGHNRHQKLTAKKVKGKTVYLPGFHN